MSDGRRDTRPNLAHARKRARRLAVQALYQWQVSDHGLADIEKQFLEEQDFRQADAEYFRVLLHGVPAVVEQLDGLLTPYMERTMPEVDPVERAILRIGAFELQQRPDIPYKVVINEAVSLAKTFGASESHRYVNGVLDKLARQTRAAEVRVAGR